MKYNIADRSERIRSSFTNVAVAQKTMLNKRNRLYTEGCHENTKQTILLALEGNRHIRNIQTLAGMKHTYFRLVNTSKAVVLKGDWSFCLPRTFVNLWRHFWLSQVGKGM